MSFLRKLFGGRTPSERLQEGERLRERGELGLARLELEAAVAAAELPPAERERARAALRATRDELARARFEEARNLAEAGERAEARSALDTALTLCDDDGLRREIEALLARLEANTEGPGEHEQDLDGEGELDEAEAAGEDAEDEAGDVAAGESA